MFVAFGSAEFFRLARHELFLKRSDHSAGKRNWEPPAGREPKAEAQDGPSQLFRPRLFQKNLKADGSREHSAPWSVGGGNRQLCWLFISTKPKRKKVAKRNKSAFSQALVNSYGVIPCHCRRGLPPCAEQQNSLRE